MSEEKQNNPQVIDLDQNSASLSIPKTVYTRILTKAIAQTKQDIQDMETALASDDMTKVQSISHRLKGDYANMRLTSLSSTAKQMNDILKTGQGKEKLPELLQEFKEYFQQLCQFIEKTDPS